MQLYRCICCNGTEFINSEKRGGTCLCRSRLPTQKKATKPLRFCDPCVIRVGLRNPAVNHWELTSYIFVYLGMPLFAHLDISMFFFVYGCKDNNNSPIFSD